MSRLDGTIRCDDSEFTVSEGAVVLGDRNTLRGQRYTVIGNGNQCHGDGLFVRGNDNVIHSRTLGRVTGERNRCQVGARMSCIPRGTVVTMAVTGDELLLSGDVHGEAAAAAPSAYWQPLTREEIRAAEEHRAYLADRDAIAAALDECRAIRTRVYADRTAVYRTHERGALNFGALLNHVNARISRVNECLAYINSLSAQLERDRRPWADGRRMLAASITRMRSDAARWLPLLPQYPPAHSRRVFEISDGEEDIMEEIEDEGVVDVHDLLPSPLLPVALPRYYLPGSRVRGRAARVVHVRVVPLPAPWKDEPDAPEKTPDAALCSICLSRLPATVCVPCGHKYACVTCTLKAKPTTCAICRAELREVIRVYETK